MEEAGGVQGSGEYDAAEDDADRDAENVRMLYRPRGAQIEALYMKSIMVIYLIRVLTW